MSGRLHRVLILASVSAALLLPSLPLRADPAAAVDIFGGLFGEMIRRDMELRQQREQMEMQRRAQAVLVRRLQTALQRLGYYRGRIDGDFGSGTQEALSAYQRDRGVYPNSSISEYDISQIEAEARSAAAPSPVANDDAQQGGGAASGGMPAVEYSAVTPAEAWRELRFAQSGLSQPGPYKAPEGGGWLIVASALDFQGVAEAAAAYAQDFPSTAIIKSSNGRYAITIGWVSIKEGKQLLDILKSQGILPGDSLVSSGSRYAGPVWTTSTALKSRNDLLRFTFLRASPHAWDRVLTASSGSALAEFRSRVTGVTTGGAETGYLSLRKAGDVSAGEITRMPEGTLLRLRETREGWSRVTLLDGREGWASSKYLTLNGDALNGTAGTHQTPATGDTPYGDKDLQDRLVNAGEILLLDVGLFLKTTPDVPGITAIAEAVSRLNTAMSARDFANIEAATANVRQLLSQNAAYRLFEERRTAERAQEEQKARAEAIKLAQKNSYFLNQYIAQNVTAPHIGTLAGLLKEFETALRFPTRAGLDDLNRRLQAAVSRENLAGAYDQILQGYVPPAPAPAAGTGDSTAPQPTTAAPRVPDDSQQAQQELRRMADEAQKLLDQVTLFGASGQKVTDVAQAARLVVNLKTALKSADGAAILRDRKALEEFLGKDPAFTDFRKREEEAERLELARKMESATKEARRMAAFIDDYIVRNFASDKLEVLISAQDELKASLKGGNSPNLFITVDRVQERIAKAGLKLELDAFKLAGPDDESPALVKCRSAVNLGQWAEARSLCQAALKEQPGKADLQALLKRAEDALAEQEKAEEQRRKQAAALETARIAATELLTNLKSFAAGRGQFGDPLRIARLAEALRGVLEGGDAARITTARDALSAGLAEDREFTAFMRDLQKGQQKIGLELLTKQDAEARRIRAFIAAYVSRNVTAAGIGAVLAADDDLVKALGGKDGDQLLKANEAARKALEEMGAAAELAAFELAPQQAEETRACLELVTQARWDEALGACRTAVAKSPQDEAANAALARTENELAERAGRQDVQNLETVRKEAAALLENLDAFTRSGAAFTDPLAIARLVAALRTSLEGQDAGALRGAATALQKALVAESAYTAFAEAHEQDRQRAALDSLAEARAENRRIKAFIEDHVARNVSSPDVPRLLDIVTSLDAAAAGQTAEAVAEANAAAGTALAALRLGAELQAFSLAPKNTAKLPQSTPNEIFVDDANRALLAGDGEDILVLFNAAGTAKGVRRDLLGRLVFPEETALCWYHDVPPPDPGVRLAFADLLARGARGVNVTGVCAADGLAGADLVALRRSSFLATDRAYAKALVDSFAAGTFQIVAEIPAASVRTRQAEDEKLAAQIREDAAQGRRAGYGVIAFGDGPPKLCRVPGPFDEALGGQMRPHLHPLAGELPGWTLATVTNADEGFAAVRRQECGALLLDGSAMGQVLAAAEREKLSTTVLPLWFEEQAVGEIQASLDRDKASRAEAEEARRRRLADEAEQDRVRRENLGEEKARQEAALRDQYESIAEGLAADAGDQIKSFVETPAAPQQDAVAEVFPGFAAWYRDQLSAGWELQSDGYGSELVDYGTTRRDGRALDTVFVQTTIGMKHRDLGKYQATCFLMGVVVDQEFARYRDVFEKPCDEAEPQLGGWKAAHGFESRWIIE